MSEARPIYDDEIDLLELFQTLWEGKWLIGLFIAIATLMGLGYAQASQTEPKYDVSVPYIFNIYSVSAQQTCNSNIGCMEAEAKKRLSFFLGDTWSPSFSFRTTTPLDSSEYQSQIKIANAALTDEMYEEAKAEVVFIQTEIANALLSTERVATNMLNAKRVMRHIDSGQRAISFGSVVVAESPSPNVLRVLAPASVLGGMVGVFFVLIRNALSKRRERLSEAQGT